ncbi:MAG: MCE family protein [Actinomycetota bacterium]|nr:MCE family protein [Actinomycetota bacterium]
MIGNRIKINLIFFLVGSLTLSYLMANQVLSILQDRYSVFAIFPDAGGVFTNQEVTYRGITVGQVGKMEVVEDGVQIELAINKRFDEIPKEGVEARVMFKSAVGEQFVDLLPASDDPPFLEDNDVIPRAQTSIPVSTQALLSTLEAVLRGVPPSDLEGAVDALGIGLTGRGPDIATILESLAVLANLFAERAPEVEGLLRDGTKVGDAFLRSRRDFARAIHELVTVSGSLANSRGDLERLLKGTNVTSDELVRLLREHRPAVHQFLQQFGEVNELQAEHSDDLNRLFLSIPSALGNVVKSFEPSTGMVRFGLVNDNENHACSYGTERRRPSDRGLRLPPKNASCGGRSSARSSAPVAPGETSSSGLPGVDDGFAIDAGSGSLAVPQRMSEWSWTLYYLRGIQG